MRSGLSACLLAAGLSLAGGSAAYAWETVHQEPAEFLGQQLPGCRQQALWLTREVKTRAEELIEHPYPGVRVRYCAADGKTAWILDEIGKTEPITSGVVVADGHIESVRVLVFRESRGGEVHRDAFTRQFTRASLQPDGKLDLPIDGITGATLSVQALKRQAKLALYLDSVVRKAEPGVSP